MGNSSYAHIANGVPIFDPDGDEEDAYSIWYGEDDKRWPQEQEIEKRLGVALHSHGAGDYCAWMLVIKESILTVEWSERKLIGPIAKGEWDETIRQALQEYELTPLAEPAWYLTASYG